MANLFKNPGKWLNDAGKSAARDWKNAGRGEVGRWASGVGQSAYNIVAAPVRAVQTGNYSRELQRIGGSTLNLASAGTFDYAGRSSGVQKFLNSDPIIGRNIGALTHGTSTTSRQGVLSNRDRNYIWQGVVKGAAVTGAVYGGAALYGYLSAPSAEAAAVGTGDIFASAGPGAVPGVLSAPAYGSSGAAASASIGTSSLAATSSGAAAAAGSSGIWSTLSKTAETLGITTAVSKLVGNQIAGSPQGTSSEIVPLPMFGGPSGAPGAPIVFNAPSGGGGGYENFSGPDLNKVAMYGAIAVGALVLMRVAKVV